MDTLRELIYDGASFVLPVNQPTETWDASGRRVRRLKGVAQRPDGTYAGRTDFYPYLAMKGGQAIARAWMPEYDLENPHLQERLRSALLEKEPISLERDTSGDR